MRRCLNSLQAKQRSAARRGAMLILLAAMLIIFFMTVAFSVDIAYMHLVRGELRTATDASVKAASEALARTQDRNLSIARAQEIALQNIVAGRGFELDASDIQFGNSSQLRTSKFEFIPNGTPINSVRVVGRRTVGSRAGSVGLFFGRMFGRDFFEPSETAIATFLERDIVLVIDRSGSMAGQKFRDLQTALGVFTDTLALGTVEERVGLASYATFSSEDLQMTTDLSQIGQIASRLPIDGLTSISSGMISGGNILSRGRNRDFVERSMLVMTDGIHNFGAEPEGVANTLAAQGIVIHTITFGADADIRRMQNVARIGRGISLQAVNGVQLQEAFRRIALTLNTVLTE